MRSYNIGQIIINYLVTFLELQFVISLMSLPILILWGIPISIMSPLANLIFTPLLILFLWISCLASICIILHIPCLFLEKMLNGITDLWLYLLSFSKPTWLVGFPISMVYISIAVSAIIVLWYIFVNKNQKTTVVFLTISWMLMILIQPLFSTKNLQQIDTLPLWSFSIAKKTYLIDNGAFCTRKNRFTNLDYNIFPKLIYHAGITTVDTIIFYKPSTQIAKVIEQCITQLNCKNFIVTQKNDCFKNTKNYFQNSSITIHPLSNKKRKTPAIS